MCDYCEWIETVVNYDDRALKNEKVENTKLVIDKPKKLAPTVIIHGSPTDAKDTEPSILDAIKKTITQAYTAVIQGNKAIDVVESTLLTLEKQCEHSTLAIKSVILASESKVSCVVGTSGDLVAATKEVLEQNQHVLRIQERKEANEVEEGEKVPGSWSVIVRDQNEEISCGRLTWEFPDDFTPSIPAAATVYGSGLFIKNQTCCSLAGSDEIIYIKIPARKVCRSLKNTDKHIKLKRHIKNLTMQYKNEKLGVAFLSACNRPVIFCNNKSFPWAYCNRNMINYGGSAGELYSEDVITDEEPNCRCHWRHERYVLEI